MIKLRCIHLCELMPNPYVVIRVMPWWRDAVGMVSPCVPILRSLCEYYDLYAYTILICWLNKWIGSSLLEPLTSPHVRDPKWRPTKSNSTPTKRVRISNVQKNLFKIEKNDSDLFQKKIAWKLKIGFRCCRAAKTKKTLRKTSWKKDWLSCPGPVAQWLQSPFNWPRFDSCWQQNDGSLAEASSKFGILIYFCYGKTMTFCCLQSRPIFTRKLILSLWPLMERIQHLTSKPFNQSTIIIIIVSRWLEAE